MSIKGVWKKFLEHMRLDDDDDDDFDEKIKKDYCMIDLNSMITLPDGGLIFKVIQVGILDTKSVAGIAVISKNKTPSLVPTTIGESLIDDESKYRLEKFLQNFCNALKA